MEQYKRYDTTTWTDGDALITYLPTQFGHPTNRMGGMEYHLTFNITTELQNETMTIYFDDQHFYLSRSGHETKHIGTVGDDYDIDNWIHEYLLTFPKKICQPA